MLALSPRRLEDLPKSLNNLRIRLFVRSTVPADGTIGMENPLGPALVAKGEIVALDAAEGCFVGGFARLARGAARVRCHFSQKAVSKG